MKVTIEQLDVMLNVWGYCDAEDKSTEFMIQYMQDLARCDHDDVMDLLTHENADDLRMAQTKYYNELSKLSGISL